MKFIQNIFQHGIFDYFIYRVFYLRKSKIPFTEISKDAVYLSTVALIQLIDIEKRKWIKRISLLIIGIFLILKMWYEMGIIIEMALFICCFMFITKKCKKIGIGSALILTQIISKEIFQFDFTISDNNPYLTIPSKFAINTIISHITIWYLLRSALNKNFLSYFAIAESLFMLITYSKHLLFVITNEHFFIFMQELFSKRCLLIYFLWIIFLYIYFSLENKIFQYKNIKLIIKRKFFHFLGFLIYVSGILIIKKEILKTISLIILYLFIFFELIRNTKCVMNSHIGKQINLYMINNIDRRDNSKLILTHIFLLSGLSSSLFYSFTNVHYYYTSAIILGVGDSMCSIFGICYGKSKIYPMNNRTLEGTIGGLISSLICYSLIGWELPKIKELLCFIIVFLYEGITTQIDNLVLPLLANNILSLY